MEQSKLFCVKCGNEFIAVEELCSNCKPQEPAEPKQNAIARVIRILGITIICIAILSALAYGLRASEGLIAPSIFELMSYVMYYIVVAVSLAIPGLMLLGFSEIIDLLQKLVNKK